MHPARVVMFQLELQTQGAPRYAVGGTMRDRNLEQRIDGEFCVRIGNSASETAAIVTLACGECFLKKLSVLSGLGG
jgi:hypothetical protein